MFEYDVSVVIISWRMKTLLQRCLSTMLKHTKEVSYEVIVIDNNSLDGTAEMVSSEYPTIKLIVNKKNMGVAPARNQGIAIARGKYILILDADMEFVDNSIQKMFTFMESHPQYGVIGCKLIDSNGNLQYSCKRFPTIISFLTRRLEFIPYFKKSMALAYHTMQDYDHKLFRDVDYVIGACQFIRAEVIAEIGSYDDTIFYGPEDIDFCLRAWQSGWQVGYFPETSIIHHEQRITKKQLFSLISLKHLYGIVYLYCKHGFNLHR